MATIFRLIAPDERSIGEADTIDQLIELARSTRPGRYRIDAVSGDPKSGVTTSMEWGEIIKERGGGISLNPPPWFD
jgi:hypothetical protein